MPVYNFSPGPAVLPPSVLEQAAAQLVDFRGEGMSLLEMSHRGNTYESVHHEALDLLRRLYALPEEFEILFLQGGASTQFAMVPLNLLADGDSADYVGTGIWSEKAISEVGKVGREFRLAGSSKDRAYSYIPPQAELDFHPDAAYVHITSNNTISGTQYQELPDSAEVPLVADASSDLLSRPLDWGRLGILYGGAQKNGGVSGLTVVIIRRDLLDCRSSDVPSMLRYSTHAAVHSLYNTPPTFAVYVLDLVLQWIQAEGGLDAIETANRRKADILYQAIDGADFFYDGHAELDSRSVMNITFRLVDRGLESAFCSSAQEAGLIGLAGHRSVGGIRASIYNAMSDDGCRALADFMGDFARKRA